MMYKLSKLSFGETTPSSVQREDGWVIPFDPDNTDYQAYLAWCAEGNEPTPAEEA